MKDDEPISIQKLYPGHTPEWYAQAQGNLRRFLSVVIRIAERLEQEGVTAEDLTKRLDE